MRSGEIRSSPMWYYRKADGEAGPFLARQMRKLAPKASSPRNRAFAKAPKGNGFVRRTYSGFLIQCKRESRQRVLPMPRCHTIDDVAASNAPLPCSFADTTPRTDLIVKPSTNSNPAFAEPPGHIIRSSTINGYLRSSGCAVVEDTQYETFGCTGLYRSWFA